MNFINILRGMVIGVANIIPGVSGGTLALVLGIYERLIGAINNISFETVKAILGLLKFNKKSWKNFTDELQRIDAFFLATILIGALISIGALAKLMTYLLEHFHDPTYGFFFGLVIVSAWVPFKLIKKHSFFSILAIIIGTVGVIAFSSLSTDEQKIHRAQVKYEIEQQKAPNAAPVEKEKFDHSPGRLAFIVFAGVVAISAMILPGISGSFLLLLMGVYFSILKAITQLDILTLGAFSIGCLFGILACTRLINFALKRWYDVTISFLLGLVLGSLAAIWPFKGTAQVGGEIIYLSNKMPSAFGSNEILTLFAAIAGGLIVLLFIYLENRNEKKEENCTSVNAVADTKTNSIANS